MPTEPTSTQPFDPELPTRLRAYLDARRRHEAVLGQEDPGTIDIRLGVPLEVADIDGLLERDAYAEQTRAQLADKCADYRGQRNELQTQLDNATAILQRLVAHVTESCDLDHEGTCLTHRPHTEPCPIASARRFVNLQAQYADGTQ